MLPYYAGESRANQPHGLKKADARNWLQKRPQIQLHQKAHSVGVLFSVTGFGPILKAKMGFNFVAKTKPEYQNM